jgi:hypothetical protein
MACVDRPLRAVSHARVLATWSLRLDSRHQLHQRTLTAAAVTCATVAPWPACLAPPPPWACCCCACCWARWAPHLGRALLDAKHDVVRGLQESAAQLTPAPPDPAQLWPLACAQQRTMRRARMHREGVSGGRVWSAAGQARTREPCAHTRLHLQRARPHRSSVLRAALCGSAMTNVAHTCWDSVCHRIMPCKCGTLNAGTMWACPLRTNRLGVCAQGCLQGHVQWEARGVCHRLQEAAPVRRRWRAPRCAGASEVGARWPRAA